MAKTKKYLVTKDEVSPTYSSGMQIATVGGKTIYVPLSDLVVTLTTQDSATVIGVTVVIHNGSSASDPVFAQKEYSGAPITFHLEAGFQYYVEISGTFAGHFNPTVISGTQTGSVSSDGTSVTFQYDDTTHVKTFDSVKKALAAGAREALVGCEIDDTWTDENGTEYSSPWRITAVKTYKGEDDQDHVGAKLVRVYANKDNVQFDAANTEEATETVVQSGIYYYGLESGQTSPTAAKLTLINPGGDNDPTYPAGSNLPTGYAKIYKNSVCDTSKNIIQYGHNRYKTSAIRQYLNSEAGVGLWWEQGSDKAHVGQVAPSTLNSLRGWKAGCSSDIKTYAKKVHFQVFTAPVDGGVIDDICDQFWIDSGTEDYGSVNSDEGTYDKYWKDASGFSSPSNNSTNGRIHNRLSATPASTPACSVWLRSPNRGYSYYVWNVYTSGNISIYYGYYANSTGISAAPACVIY